MKKLLALSLILILALPAALADGVDLSSMSYDELTALRSQLEQEIMSRPEWKEVQVPPGNYVAGVDFPAGRYTVELRSSNTGSLIFSVYQDEKAETIYSKMYMVSMDNPTASITFKEGNFLVLTSGSLWLKPYRGLFGE